MAASYWFAARYESTPSCSVTALLVDARGITYPQNEARLHGAGVSMVSWRSRARNLQSQQAACTVIMQQKDVSPYPANIIKAESENKSRNIKIRNKIRKMHDREQEQRQEILRGSEQVQCWNRCVPSVAKSMWRGDASRSFENMK